MAGEKNGKKTFTGELPHNLEAEQSILGCLMIDRDIQLDVLSSLSDEDFYAESHGYIFEAMVAVNRANVPVDRHVDRRAGKGRKPRSGGRHILSDFAHENYAVHGEL